MPQIPATLAPGVGYSPSARPPTNSLAGAMDGSSYTYLTPNEFWEADGPSLDLPSNAVVNLYDGPGLTVPETFFGAHWHNWPNTQPSGVKVGEDGTLLEDCGLLFKTARTHDYSPNANGSTRWHHIEPSKGNFYWDNYDQFVDTHHAAGRDIISPLGFTPSWATTQPGYSSGGSVSVYTSVASNPPDSLTDWADYCAAVATRYAGKITHYEVWNEANGTGRWFNGSYTQYAQLLRVAHETIKAIDPAATIVTGVLAGALAASNLAWFDNAMSADDGNGGIGGDWLEAFSFHIYINSSGNQKSLVADMAAARDLLHSYGASPDIEIMCSEGGIGVPYVDQTNGADVQRRLLRMYLLLASLGVSRYMLYDVDGGILAQTGHAFGLMRWRSTAPMVAFLNGLRSMLLNGEVTRVNQLWDGRIAYIRNGERLIA